MEGAEIMELDYVRILERREIILSAKIRGGKTNRVLQPQKTACRNYEFKGFCKEGYQNCCPWRCINFEGKTNNG